MISILTRLLLCGAWCLGVQAQGAQNPAPAPSPTPAVVPTPQELSPRLVPPPPDGRALPDRAVPRELGKPEDDLTLDVSAYAVDPGAPLALREALPGLTAAYVGKARHYEDLVNAAAEVTRFLQRELGYYLGYAYIPEQTTDDQVVRIAVLEGRLDEVSLVWPDDMTVDRAVVEAYLAELQPGEILTVREVERVIFLLNDLRGLSMRAEVKAGSRPGTASLVFTPRPDQRYSVRIDGDANGSRFIGQHRLGALLSVNSPTGRGDGLTATLLGSTDGGLQFGLLGYTLPWGASGLKVGASLALTRYRLDPDEFPLGIEGESTNLNLFALYPWVRSRNLNLFTLGALDHKAYVDSIVNLETKRRATNLTLGVTGDFRDTLLKGGVNTFDLQLVHGRIRYPDGRPTGIDDAASFSKLGFTFSRLQDVLTNQLMAYLAVKGQWAFDNLDTTEQLRAGGPDGVRAFAPGEGTGDSGLIVSTELRWLPPDSLLGPQARNLVFGLFADAALIELRHDPTQIVRAADYDNRRGYAGAGVSVVWQLPGRASARLSLAKPVRGTPVGDTQERDPRLYLQFSYTF